MPEAAAVGTSTAREDPIASILRQSLTDASRERQEQTAAYLRALDRMAERFDTSIKGLRSELRLFAGIIVLAIVILGAAVGVKVIQTTGGELRVEPAAADAALSGAGGGVLHDAAAASPLTTGETTEGQ